MIDAAETVAEQTGVSRPIVKRSGKLADAIDKTGLQVDNNGLTAGEIVPAALTV